MQKSTVSLAQADQMLHEFLARPLLGLGFSVERVGHSGQWPKDLGGKLGLEGIGAMLQVCL